MHKPNSKILILLLINVLLLIVGCFMETLCAIMILAPILFPVVTALGVDVTHFGIIMVVNLAIALIAMASCVEVGIQAQHNANQNTGNEACKEQLTYRTVSLSAFRWALHRWHISFIQNS